MDFYSTLLKAVGIDDNGDNPKIHKSGHEEVRNILSAASATIL
jgi:hypothetical protein